MSHQIGGIVPPGVVWAYAGATAPTGWLLCDGTTIARATYTALFAAIGTAHGTGDGSTTFHLPDYRGRFLRGVDSAVGRDPDRASRIAANTGGNTGDNVGSVQGLATAIASGTQSGTKSTTGLANSTSSLSGISASASSISGTTNGPNTVAHTHAMPTTALTLTGGSNLTPNNTNNASNVNTLGVNDQGLGSHTHTFGGTAAAQTISGGTAASQSISGDNETRPLNANVTYIIKT